MSLDADAKRTVEATVSAFGRIDILVTAAGSSPGGLLADLTEEDWLSSLRLKFLGYVRSIRYVLPHMQAAGSGSIVLVVGNDGLKPSYWELTAGAANAADINVASAIAEQYGPFGIRVNTVNPGPVATDRWDGLEKAFARDMNVSQERAHALALRSLPLGRICEADEVAAFPGLVGRVQEAVVEREGKERAHHRLRPRHVSRIAARELRQRGEHPCRRGATQSLDGRRRHHAGTRARVA